MFMLNVRYQGSDGTKHVQIYVELKNAQKVHWRAADKSRAWTPTSLENLGEEALDFDQGLVKDDQELLLLVPHEDPLRFKHSS